MNRLQKKCIIASTGMHGLLVLILFVGPAFFSKPKQIEVPIIELVGDFKVTDGRTRGGGNPNAAAAAPQAAQPAPPQPAPPQPTPPQPAPPEPVRQPDPPKPEPKVVEKEEAPEPVKPREVVKTKEPSFEVAKKPTKPQKLDLRPVTRSSDTKTTSQKLELKPVTRPANSSTRTGTSTSRTSSTSAAQQRASALNALAQSFGRAGQSISSSVESGTSVELSGPGGEAFVNYGDLVGNVYQRRYDVALIKAGDIANNDSSVDVTVTISRNGKVISSRLVRGSGNAALDRLVRRILDEVDSLPPFPEGARDAQRNFNITFDLKSRGFNG